MKKISRKGFLKIAAAAAMSGVTAGALAACESASSAVSAASGAGSVAAGATYIPGTYEATAAGINGDVKVTMTFTENAITDVVLDVSGETPSIGGAAAEDLKNALMEAQGADIQPVSGATITSNGVIKAAQKCIDQAKGVATIEVVNLPTGDENDWLGTEPTIDEASITDTWDTDILIVGAGNGGPDYVLPQMEQAEEAGCFFKADTLEELADKLGFTGTDKETFLATVERYNELYDQQNDEDFGKPAYRLSAIRKAPFYGCWLGASLLTTEQGIAINEKGQALDTNNEPMPGLYITGDMSGSFFANNYPCLMAGVAMGRTVTFAMKAIKQMAGLDEA